MVERSATFDGPIGGKTYDVVAPLFGLTSDLYRRAAMAMPILPGMRLLDVGCGTGSLTLPMAARLGGRGEVVGVDIAKKQVERAKEKAAELAYPVRYQQASLTELPFDDGAFDMVVAGFVLHAVREDLRQSGIDECTRLLGDGGRFVLVDWSTPRVGLTSLVWLPSIIGEMDGDNWSNRYPEHLAARGFALETDVYLDSLYRCQVFSRG